MKKSGVLLALALLLSPVVAQAQQSNAQPAPASIDVSNLSEEKRRAMQVVASQMAADKTDVQQVVDAVQNIDSAKIRGWADAGTEAGKAVGNFTREIGLVAKDFLDTSVGQAVFFLLFMNYGGGELAQFVFDVLIFSLLTPFFGWFMWRVFQRYVLRLQVTRTTAYNKNTFLRWIGINKTVKTVVAAPRYIIKDDKGAESDLSGLISLGAMVVITFLTVMYLTNLWPVWSAAS